MPVGAATATPPGSGAVRPAATVVPAFLPLRADTGRRLGAVVPKPDGGGAELDDDDDDPPDGGGEMPPDPPPELDDPDEPDEPDEPEELDEPVVLGMACAPAAVGTANASATPTAAMRSVDLAIA